MQMFFASVKEPQCFFAAFSPDAALFHAAKGNAQVAHDGNRAGRFHF